MELDFLYQDYDQRLAEFTRLNNKLAHYTNVDNARNILHGQTLWLRSADQQIDKYELKYGMALIEKYAELRADLIRKVSMKSSLDFLNLLTFRNDHYWKKILTNTFLASFVVHSPHDDGTGRIDMWDRYATPEGVAFVLKAEFLSYDDNVSGLYPLPVRYFTQDKLNEFLDSIVSQMFAIQNDRAVMRKQSEIAVQLVCLIASIKRMAFRAEEEWRLIANSSIERLGNHLSPRVSPRRIELDLAGVSGSKFTLANSLERILIGPGANQHSNRQIIKKELHSLNLDNIPVTLSSI